MGTGSEPDRERVCTCTTGKPPMTNENEGVKKHAVAAADLGLGGKPMWLHGIASPWGYFCLQANVAVVQARVGIIEHMSAVMFLPAGVCNLFPCQTLTTRAWQFFGL